MFRIFLYSAILLVFASAVLMLTARTLIDHWFGAKLKFVSIIMETAGKAFADAEKEKQARKLAADTAFDEAVAQIRAHCSKDEQEKLKRALGIVSPSEVFKGGKSGEKENK